MSEGLGRTWNCELLDNTLPPALGDVLLGVLAASELGDYLAPERLRLEVARHLPNLPGPGMTGEDKPSQGAACSSCAIPLEDEELLHP